MSRLFREFLSWMSANATMYWRMMCTANIIHTDTHQPACDRSHWTEYWLEHNVNNVCDRLLNFQTSLIFSLDSLAASAFFAFIYVNTMCVCVFFYLWTCVFFLFSCYSSIRSNHLIILVDYLYLEFQLFPIAVFHRKFRLNKSGSENKQCCKRIFAFQVW